MSKRHFYTDPLAAAWMAKHFGMQLIRRDNWAGPDRDVRGIMLDCYHNVGNGPYDVHPASLHLLEPQVGDICEGRNAFVGKVTKITDEVIDLSSYGSISAMQINSIDEVRIIQRAGIAFHWPEQES